MRKGMRMVFFLLALSLAVEMGGLAVALWQTWLAGVVGAVTMLVLTALVLLSCAVQHVPFWRTREPLEEC